MWNEILELELRNMKEDINDMKETNKEDHKVLSDWITDIKWLLNSFILDVKTNYITEEKANIMFAGKMSEKIVYSMVVIILTTVLGWILFGVLK